MTVEQEQEQQEQEQQQQPTQEERRHKDLVEQHKKIETLFQEIYVYDDQERNSYGAIIERIRKLAVSFEEIMLPERAGRIRRYDLQPHIRTLQERQKALVKAVHRYSSRR